MPARCASSSTTAASTRSRRGFRIADNDSRILAVAANLAAEGVEVVLVSKDLPLRVKAAAVGLAAQEYRAELAVSSGWSGMAELDVPVADLDARVGEAGQHRLSPPGASAGSGPGRGG